MTPSQIKELFERTTSAVTRRPDFARHCGRALVRMGDGFACDVEHEDQRGRADEAAAEGGTGTAPDPDQLMRASLGASLAMGYRRWAAYLDVAIAWVTVELTCDSDARGRLGVSADVPVGWQRVLVHVTVASDAARAAVREVVDKADRLNPILANLTPSIRRTHHLTVVHPHPQSGADRPQQPARDSSPG